MSTNYNIILNGKIVKGIRGETILQCANRNGIEIPTLCNDPRIDPFTSCYVCVVEVEGMRGLQPSCSTKVYEGMKINTENPRVIQARKTALDLLLSNHYADCLGPCKQTCPAGVDVQGYISLIDKGMYSEAVALIKETNPLPAICGRVCVRPCEVACRRNLLDEGAPVGIDYLKRFASDIDLASPDKFKPVIQSSTGKKVAVIGAGPGGLSCGFFLQKEGHQVDIYEASPKAGGWLRYGIPEYRLPNELLQKEVDNITEMGVNIYYNKSFGSDVSYKEIKKKYDALILTIGSQKGTGIGCEGDDAGNVMPGIDFLKTMEITGKRFDFKGKTVAVIGGGNTAMDCCRSAKRCGASSVFVIYRRTEKEMPANPIEIHESKLEGVDYMFLTAPIRVNKDDQGNIRSITCIKMELGEPDASGRRRPIPKYDSEFEVPVDYALAAIGQKTDINFLDDINSFSADNQLNPNKWGDIDADKDTLQTGIPSVFAAGDAVTGPATLIEAIAQARKASHSCHQYVSGLPVEPMQKEFISRKENFMVQVKSDYLGKFPHQLREEMPTLEPSARNNFTEVELGYANEEVAKHESQRCLECGCSEYYTCDLKRFSTEYHAEQNKFKGAFNKYEVDFRHPFIEIDNNKCILCSRCIRICRDVVGANALGLINRGSETYVAPSMGNALQDTKCESCGMCISTCPTGAITENFPFKPGPVRTDIFETICNYCSVGCKIILHHKNGFIMKTTGAEGLINNDGNICRYPKFGYQYLNQSNRISKPLLKVNGQFHEIEFDKAYEIIAGKIKSVTPDENAFYAGARLTNEEIYLIQKFARAGAGTNNVTSFQYIENGMDYRLNSLANVPFDQIKDASKIYLIGSEINMDNAVAGFMINVAREKYGIPVTLITTKENSAMKEKVDQVITIRSYYHFIKAVNYYLMANQYENQMFIDDNCEVFYSYKENLLSESFMSMIRYSGVPFMDSIIEFAREFNREMNAVIVFSEKELSPASCFELFNLSLITGKLGKTASGLISLKEKNNSQGLFDMGAFPGLMTGNRLAGNPEQDEKIKKIWKITELPQITNNDQYGLLEAGLVKNMFIFGEDPLGCAVNREKVSDWLEKANFIMVQDYIMSETAARADLVMPASFPFESGGSFTNTQKVIQKIEKWEFSRNDRPLNLGYEQHIEMLSRFNINGLNTIDDIMSEIFSLLPDTGEQRNYKFVPTRQDDLSRLFTNGCDQLILKFDKEFSQAVGDRQ
ncbi:MAG: FAD-dependent oxidoreductase [Bacteroidia bacterium]|nr:FAD-dependent oxidoreductase [Bacteroidia bacterium]